VPTTADMAAFVPLPVCFQEQKMGAWCCGVLQLPQPPPGPPSAAVLARLDPLLRAHGDALAAQAEGLDPERLSRTYAALMAELQEAAGMRVSAVARQRLRVDAVALTPETLRAVLPRAGDGGQLMELPEGLRALARELRVLEVQSEQLNEVPAWVGELTRLEALELNGNGNFREENTALRALPTELFQLGALKQLTLSNLNQVQAMPDASGLTRLEVLEIDRCRKLTTLPAGLGQLGTLKQLTLSNLDQVQAMPDASGLTRLEALKIYCCAELQALPAGLGQLGTLKELTLSNLDQVQAMPDASGLTRLEVLKIDCCAELQALSAGLGQLGTLKELTLSCLDQVQAMPDASGLTSLETLEIDRCCDLPASIGQLGALKQLTLFNVAGLEKITDILGKLTSLEHLVLGSCKQLKTLPASIMHLSRLQELNIELCPLQDMPCIEALTALRSLVLQVSDYRQGSRAFKALSRSLPCLQLLDNLMLRGWSETDEFAAQFGYRSPEHLVALRAEDVLAVGRALRAWPLPLLREFDYDESRYGLRLSTCWQALGLTAAAADWSDETTLEHFRVQQHKVAAFASGMHARLGVASEVSGLDEQTLAMIADEVLGGWGLLSEWRQQEQAGAGGGTS